ncbi:inner membrane transporter RhtA [Streptosporangium subroseum]|uniref:Inner membrane transporter RhtA n=1 Tax=Streptosporangium subroseum TaxID=106412 RepID=A0A239EEW5_9ACTN|nr:hypothetical protein [Streptosporangium subroseum]SNS43147.1 inner membrane transporter RhtA [Streptosporangium subroseum]
MLTGIRLAGEPLGLVFAFANAVLFAVYIVIRQGGGNCGKLSPVNPSDQVRRPRTGSLAS